MECPNLFSWGCGARGKKTISVCRLLKSLPKVLCVNAYAGNIGSSFRLFVIPDI